VAESVPQHEDQSDVARLARRLAAPDVVDGPVMTGLHGLAWLERYEHDGDPDALATGLARLWEAIAAGPEHPERHRWFYWLGLGYGERGRRRRAVADYHRAIECVSIALADGPPDDTQRARVVVTLSELCWERFWFVRHGAGTGQRAALTAVDDLLGTARPRLTRECDPVIARATRRIVGLTHLERYELGRGRADLDRGIALLAAASLWDTPADTPTQVMAAIELAEAYRRRAHLDADTASLDLAIDAGNRTLDHLGDDRLATLVLHHVLALAHEARWRFTGARADLDRAIDCWRALMGADGPAQPDAWEAARCGDLLRERGELTGDPVEIAEAIVLLELAAGTS
jgi:hypothetical protein